MGIVPIHFIVGTRDGDLFLMHDFLTKVNLALATNALKLSARHTQAFFLFVPFLRGL